MAQYTTPTQLSGLFKESYGDEVQSLVPDSAKLTKIIPFVSRDKELGSKYHQPVVVTSENGVTYAAADSGAFALEDSVSMTLQDAQIQGSQMLLRSAMSYDAASRASNSKKAFVKGTELLVENMMESLHKRLEISLLHGQVGIGVNVSSVNVDATHTTIQLTTASFAAGIYSGIEGAKVQFYLVSNNNLVSSGADSVFAIDSVDIDNRKIVVSGTATGITALDAAADTNIFFKGSYGNEMAGMAKIISNTGTLFNISAVNYVLWKGNTYSAGSAALTMAKILSAVGKGVQRGLDEKVCVAVNPLTWANLASDIAALRSFDSSYDPKEQKSGTESLKYIGQNGEIEIISHNLVKEGEAFIFPPKRCKRVGAQEASFKTPGREDEIFLHLPSNAGFELRVYSDQALFIEAPAKCIYISGIVNS